MKITLSPEEMANLSAGGAQLEEIARAVDGCKLGDWEARHELERLFNPLIATLAFRRAGDDAALRNELIERGRAGLYRAAKRFPKRECKRRFRLFALDHIEAAMNRPLGVLSRWFG
jgi:DNA-directed RNA polymerase specialized sigma subunit